jgi:hypothetical protein
VTYEIEGLPTSGEKLLILVAEQESGIRRVDADEFALSITSVVEIF